MDKMFCDGIAFNGDISEWDVSQVTDMIGVFSGTEAFNGDISKWDVARVASMGTMFSDTHAFNGDISKWDVSSVTDMRGMFFNAEGFNVDIPKWDVSSVTNMILTFSFATSFKQKLCGAAWVNSKAEQDRMFQGSPGSISETVCASASLPDRELIVRTPSPKSVSAPAITPTMAKTMTCPNCGTFKKSGRSSCCAPGGAWFKNCGGARNRNVGHKWFEGVAACKRTTTIIVSVCQRCGTIAKSGKPSCCGRGGSWFKNCGGGGNTKHPHTWYDGIQACKARSQSKRVIDNQLDLAQQKQARSSQGAGMDTYKAVTIATKTFTVTSVKSSTRMSEDTTSIVTSTNTLDNVIIITSAPTLITNTPTNTLMTSPTHSSAITPMITRGFVSLLKIIVHMNILFIIVF